MSALQAVHSGALRAMMAQFPTGVTIVGTGGHGPDQGMTANSITCVSLDPPLVAISLTRDTRTERAISASGGFAVTFLSQQQAELATQFARPNNDRFRDMDVARTGRGYPYFRDGLGFIECVTTQHLDAGDHRVIFGLVTESVLNGGEPLLFFRSRFGSVAGEPVDRTVPTSEERQ